MRISTGKSRKDTAWKVKDISWNMLLEKLKSPIRTTETMAEYHAMTKAEKAEVKDVGGFVGGVIKGGRRLKPNIECRSLVTLDADYATKDVWDKVESLIDYEVACYSTHSHTPKLPRLRFIIPLDRDVTSEEYEPIARQVASDIGIEQFDITTYETSRLMFWPSVPADGEYIFKVNSGDMLSADRVLSRYADWHKSETWPISTQEKRVIAKAAKQQGDPEAKPGLVGLFCRTYDVPSAIDRFLPDEYAASDDASRYTYTGGSTANGAVLYGNGKFIYSHHSTDPAGGVLCNAFDLVRLHKFGHMDDDVTPDTLITQYPSYKAMTEFAASDPAIKEELVKAKLAKAQEVFSKDPDTSWAEQLSVDKRGNVEATIDNIVIILDNDPNLAGCIALNQFTNRLCSVAALPWRACPDPENGEAWSDVDDSALRHYLEKTYGISAQNKIDDAVNVISLRHSFHPIRTYLSNLKWDGVPRAEALFINCLGADDNKYTRTVTRKWLTAAVARVMRPGIKWDNMIVLVGSQGIGKSYLGKKLGRSWFSDTFSTLAGKEAYEQLKGAWILEMGELSVMKKAEVESVKMFVSKQEDNYRAAYGRHPVSNKRQCVFYGTTNDDAFLRDHTGNRRFWPIGCDMGKAKGSVFELSDSDIDQIWAEARTWFEQGEELYLSPEIAKLAEAEQEKYMTQDPRLGSITDYLDMPIPVNWDKLTKTDRRNYIQGFLKTEGDTMPRETISVVELAYELYGIEVLQPWQAKEYHSILADVPGWRKTTKQKRSVYGKQPYYERIPPDGA